jgi:hypothetical protein
VSNNEQQCDLSILYLSPHPALFYAGRGPLASWFPQVLLPAPRLPFAG